MSNNTMDFGGVIRDVHDEDNHALRVTVDNAITLSAGANITLTQVDSNITIATSGSNIHTFLSSASVGGAATEPYTVTGLLSTDTIIAVSPAIATGTNTWIRGFGTPGNGTLNVQYGADPAAGGKVLVSVIR